MNLSDKENDVIYTLLEIKMQKLSECRDILLGMREYDLEEKIADELEKTLQLLYKLS